MEKGKGKRVFRLNAFRLSVLISFMFFFVFLFKEEQGWNFGFFDLMELKSLDVKFLDRGPRPQHDKVAIVAIDEKSIERFGLYPWSRMVMAQLFGSIAEAGSSVIAYDGVFADEDRTNLGGVLGAVAEGVKEIGMDNCPDCEKMRGAVLSFLKEESENSDPDKIFAEMIRRIDRVILGFFIFTNHQELKSLDLERLAKGLECVSTSKINLIKPWNPEEEKYYTLRLRKGLAVRSPLPVFCSATSHFGHFSFNQDEDGTLRWADLVEEVESPDKESRLIYPALSLAAAAMYMDKEIVLHTYPKGVDSISLGLGADAITIPTNPLGRMLINYMGRENTFHTYSAVDVIDGTIPKEALKNKVILVGATATGIFDLRVTPFQEDFPGVEIHANIIDNILSQNYISRPDWAFYFELFIILFIGITFGYVLNRVPALWGALFMVFSMAAYYLIDKHFFFANGYWVRSVLPITQAFVIFLICYVYRYVTEEKEKKRTRAAFQQYLNKSVIDIIMNDFNRLKLGGEKREISVLFSDIRGFTSVSEKLQPDELGHILNEYLNPMTQIVFQTEGVLDKYMGDAVMAFWGAPHPQVDHAERACRTAIMMMRKLEELNKLWAQRGIPHLRIGIGVNTGPMWVGNMGSSIRFDYTVIGDAVNLGSRLEGTNKQYGTSIIISEFTKAKIGETFLCRRLDSIRVKGKLEPVTIYELIAEGPGSDLERQFVAHFDEGLTFYRERRWDEAIRVFEEILSDHPDDGPSLLFRARCQQYRETPPPPSWDGVYVMTTK